jgi:hypothetical protein
MMNPESDDAFLQELISRIPAATGKSITLSKGTFRLSEADEKRLLEIAKRRGKIATKMLEEML